MLTNNSGLLPLLVSLCPFLLCVNMEYGLRFIHDNIRSVVDIPVQQPSCSKPTARASLAERLLMSGFQDRSIL